MQNKPLIERLLTLNHHIVTTLHLVVSLRSFCSEKVASFVKALLDADSRCAQILYTETSKNYPIF